MNFTERKKAQLKMSRKEVLAIVFFFTANNPAVLEHGKYRTYQHRDPVTGKMLLCNQCPPGTHLQNHCTTKHQTVCALCPAQHYTQYWNYLPMCLYCNNFCRENQFVKEECSPTYNRVCECKKGYYWDSEFCIKHTECPSGYGVKAKGTANKDTVCEKCLSGYFSSKISSHLSCMKHTNCTAHGLKRILKGTSWHDNLCISFSDFQVKGTLSLYREIILEFFSHQKMKLKKVVRFGKKSLNEQLLTQLKGNGNLSAQKLMCIYVKQWMSLQKPGTNVIKKLLEMLKKSQLHNVASRFGNKFKGVLAKKKEE
ncbi:tumor necrosis factor receptor superfamily member 6B [Lepisosteus oculatus]|uniref:Tumor necrosis factor receptor superfamily member 11B-like n=1 Tax=Lepisosteus oculatus TaxID=7918 RepID=W5MRQ6_LEPOC|nr:PREDICTED: tumor necrosis factor receptor superfamily member 11B-like [Lepisosteus oculatus]